ncbi:methyl-accepting chemotaxis protein [Ideonella sp.]|uniref:methyl-accepting chemotaxis protein n=1 Tax=Ideonella sp. TaxID=1929293 RepID=UPI0037C097D0
MIVALRSLRGRMVAATGVLMLLSLLSLAAYNAFAANAAAMHALRDEAFSIGQAHVGGVTEWLDSHAAVVESLAPAVDDPDPTGKLLQAAQSGGFEITHFGYADKRYVSSKLAGMPPEYDPTRQPWYQQAAQSDQVELTEPHLDATSGHLMVGFGKAIHQQGRVYAVVAADASLANVSKSVSKIQPTPLSYGFIVSRTGKVVAHRDPGQLQKAATELSPVLTADWLSGTDKSLLEARIGEHDMLLTAQAIGDSGWSLVVAMHRDESLAEIHALIWKSMIGGVLLSVLCVLLLGSLVASQLRGLGRLRDAMREVAQGDGDLTRRLTQEGRDELSEIAHDFNQFVGKIRGTLVEIRATSESVRIAASEIAVGNLDLSNRTEHTASNLQDTASFMAQMTDRVIHSADVALQATQLARSAAEAAERGGEAVGRVVNSMERMSDSSKRISEIIGVIDCIAFQTNILALNAAVEAARAGEQGRGFAVVAAEVRSLAQRSAVAAREIKGLIDTSVNHVEAGAAQVYRTGEVMQDIVAGVRRVADLIGDIAEGAREQRDGLAQVNQSVTQLDQMTQQNAALVEQSAAAAASLNEQATRLASSVGGFRTGQEASAALA